jgi:hypothetical protein
VARPGSFGVKPQLRRAEVLQFHQFAVPDWPADDALRQAREWRQQCAGIAGKNSLFQRLQFRNRDGAARHRHDRRPMCARDGNLLRPAARPVETAPAPRGRSRKRRIDVARLVGRLVIGSVISRPAAVEGKAPAEILGKAPVVVMREFVETVQGPAMGPGMQDHRVDGRPEGNAGSTGMRVER